jgi:hypothetical protein
MENLFNDICILVTAAFVLTFVPGLRLQDRSLLSMRDEGTALLVFLVLGLVEEASFSRSGWLNERIVAVCAAGLMAGPWVGLAVSVFVMTGKECRGEKSNEFSSRSAREPTLYRCCAIGCKLCSVARFAWKSVARWDRAQQLLYAFP